MQRVNVNRKWMPIVAGILDLISGAFQLLVFVSILGIALIAFGFGEGLFGASVPPEVAIFFLPPGITGILAIVGGVYTLKRKKMGLAYMGAIAAFFPIVPIVVRWALVPILGGVDPRWTLIALFLALLGIPPIVLTSLSKKEFEGE